MNFEVIATPEFERQAKVLAKRHRSFKSDLRTFIESLENNPFQGDELTPGLRKIRMAISSKSRGKSGGARVITYTVVADVESGRVYLMNVYDKSDYSTVELSVLKKKITELG